LVHRPAGSLARWIVEGIEANKLDLAWYLVEDVPQFDPAHPDDIDQGSLPASPARTPTAPEGRSRRQSGGRTMNAQPISTAVLVLARLAGCALAIAALGAAPTDETNQGPPTDWVEPSGHRVIRLSREPGSGSLYFHQNAYYSVKFLNSLQLQGLWHRPGHHMLVVATMKSRGNPGKQGLSCIVDILACNTSRIS